MNANLSHQIFTNEDNKPSAKKLLTSVIMKLSGQRDYSLSPRNMPSAAGEWSPLVKSNLIFIRIVFKLSIHPSISFTKLNDYQIKNTQTFSSRTTVTEIQTDWSVNCIKTQNFYKAYKIEIEDLSFHSFAKLFYQNNKTIRIRKNFDHVVVWWSTLLGSTWFWFWFSFDQRMNKEKFWFYCHQYLLRFRPWNQLSNQRKLIKKSKKTCCKQIVTRKRLKKKKAGTDR